MATPLRSPDEMRRIAACGRRLWSILHEARGLVRPGVSPAHIESAIRLAIRSAGARPVLAGLGGAPGRAGFPASACISVNDRVTNGVPGGPDLAEGDVVTIDSAIEIDGWVCDAAVSVGVGRPGEGAERLLRATREAIESAAAEMRPGLAWERVGEAIGRVAERHGVSVADVWAGHGVGRWVHESPRLAVPPPWGSAERWGRSDAGLVLRPGMVLAVEPTFCLGRGEVVEAGDGWGWRTGDGGMSAYEERTVGVTRSGGVVLTGAVGVR